jgi:hypothetical protein
VPDIGTGLEDGYSKVVEFIRSWNSSGYPTVESGALGKSPFMVLGDSKKDEKLKLCSGFENGNKGAFDNDEIDAANVAQELSLGTWSDKFCEELRICGR